MENWKDIEGYEGLYQVSNEGRIKSLERVVMRSNGRPCTIKETIIKPQKYSNANHLAFTLIKNGYQKTMPIHRAVAQAFIPNLDPTKYTIVHHIDHNPQNNNVENLMWMTKNEHQALHNSIDKTKFVYQYKDCELVAVWDSVGEAAKTLDITKVGIYGCCNKRLKTYNGYKWSYEPL